MRTLGLNFSSSARCLGKRGFSFMEILVATIILLIGISGIIGMLFWGRGVLKQKENKARAMNVASSIMEEFLAQSYDTLGTKGKNNPPVPVLAPANPGPSGVGLMMSDQGNLDNIFHWHVFVWQEQMSGSSGPPNPPAGHTVTRIPYRKIEVVVSYSEETPRSKNRFYQQQVRLVNIVPYPFMHTIKVERGTDLTPYVSFGSGMNYSDFFDVGGSGLYADFHFETPRNLQIIYNIAIGIELSAVNPVPQDSNLETAIFLIYPDSSIQQIATITGTNVITQPLITNNTSYSAIPLPPGNYRLEVKWRLDQPGGLVYLREANLVIWATEPE